jgi:hypothetical protein
VVNVNIAVMRMTLMQNYAPAETAAFTLRKVSTKMPQHVDDGQQCRPWQTRRNDIVKGIHAHLQTAYTNRSTHPPVAGGEVPLDVTFLHLAVHRHLPTGRPVELLFLQY